MSARLDFMISIGRCSDGSLRLIVRAFGDDERRLSAHEASVMLTFWQEADDVVRFRLKHISSGTVGYMQANESLLALCDALGLSVSA